MFCKNCNEECEGIWVDFGSGKGEFWGAPYNDVQEAYVSDCCEDDIISESGRPAKGEYHEDDHGYGDWLYEQWKDKQGDMRN